MTFPLSPERDSLHVTFSMISLNHHKPLLLFGSPLEITPEQPTSFEEATAQAHAVVNRPVLVVDDDAGMRMMLQTVLEEEGYRVELARNGREALEKIKQSRPGLVLLDLMMPVMNGWQFLEAIKDLPEGRDLPIVLLSASRDLPSTARQNQGLIRGHLPKPFDLEKLFLYVERYRQ